MSDQRQFLKIVAKILANQLFAEDNKILQLLTSQKKTVPCKSSFLRPVLVKAQ